MRGSVVIYKSALVAVVAAALACSAAQAQDKPSATIDFHGGNVAFIAGVNWGGGVLHTTRARTIRSA